MVRYIQAHINKGKYLGNDGPNSGRFHHIDGWEDHLICDNLIYSHRKTDYTKDRFDETAHIHDYYELVLYVSGNVDYVTDLAILAPAPMAAVWFAPGEIHNTRLRAPSCYERYVFYFHSSLFSFEGKSYPLCPFLEQSADRFFRIGEERRPALLSSLDKLDRMLLEDTPNHLLCYAEVIRLLSLLNASADRPTGAAEKLPEKMLQIKQYIDDHYADLSSVSELADRFFYSREYISRLFRKYYNVSVSEYLTQLRINQSIQLLRQGHSVTDSYLAVGFKSQSAYSLSFRKQIGLSPSEYLRRKKQ